MLRQPELILARDEKTQIPRFSPYAGQRLPDSTGIGRKRRRAQMWRRCRDYFRRQQCRGSKYTDSEGHPESSRVQAGRDCVGTSERHRAASGGSGGQRSRDRLGCIESKSEYMPELHRASTAPTFAVSSDHVEIGRIQGKQFAALLPQGGSILYLEGPSQSSSAQKRTAGMLENKPSNIQVVMLKGRWTEESAEQAVVSWLKLATSQNKSIDLVGAQDDAMAMGARKAFEKVTNDEERARWLSLPFTGCDGQLKTGQAWVRQGLLAATIYLPPLAGTAIEILAKSIQQGTRPPERTTTESFSIPALDTLAPRKSQSTPLPLPVRGPFTPSKP